MDRFKRKSELMAFVWAMLSDFCVEDHEWEVHVTYAGDNLTIQFIHENDKERDFNIEIPKWEWSVEVIKARMVSVRGELGIK